MDHQALAHAVNDRMGELGLSQQDLAVQAGIAIATLRRIQRGIPQRRGRATLAALSRALRWEDGHLQRVYDPDNEPAGPRVAAGELVERVAAIEQRLAALEQRLTNPR